jgi:thiol-disulfide isomerase/thioredoxin
MKTSTRNSFIIALLVAVVILMFIRYVYPDGPDGFQSAPTFTLYYADWCPHCKTIKPVFEEWSKKGSVVVGGKTIFVEMVEADKNADKLKGKPVKGYPTFLLETNGAFKEFDGDRTAAGWESWLSQNA